MRILVGFGIVVLALCGCRVKSQRSCITNLRMIDGAKMVFAADRGLTNGAVVTKEQLIPYLHEWPQCPSGDGQYSIGKIGDSPKCSYAAHSHYESP